ncbi:MAG TPA: hypothetical protein VHC22_29205 [Pirellulales bacterium]|nr:hypothetical protein [Pirellulales bacterium]
MFVSNAQGLRRSCLGVVSAALAACLLPAFGHDAAQAQTAAQANGRIYVATSYRLKREGAEEEKTSHSAIIAIDPATGDWQVIVEKDATKGSAGDHVRLSPDRRTLVFTRHRDGIWKCESDGQFPVRIFDFRVGSASFPIWSPDSKHLVVHNSRAETWQIDADGRNPVKLQLPDNELVCDWSSDGQWFVTCTGRESQHGQLYLMKTDGTQRRRLTESGGNLATSSPRFSPDGKKIVYNHSVPADGRSIWTVDVDGGSATQLVTEAGLSVPTGALWSPEGKQIAVILSDWRLLPNGKRVRPRLDTADYRIEIMDADGTHRRRIPLKGARFDLISSWADWR